MTPRILLIRINFDALIHKNASLIPCTSLKEHLPRPFFLLDFRWLMSLGLKWRLPTWGQVEPPGALALKQIIKNMFIIIIILMFFPKALIYIYK